MGRKQEETALDIAENHEFEAQKKRKNRAEAKHKRRLEENQPEVKKKKKKREEGEDALKNGSVLDCVQGTETVDGSYEIGGKKRKKVKKHKREKEEGCLGSELRLDCAEECEIVNGSGEIGKKKKKKHEEREDEDKSLNSGQKCDGNSKNDVIVQESGTLNGSNEFGKKKKKKHKEGREEKSLNDGLFFYDAQKRKILDGSNEECDGERESCSGVVVSGKDTKEIKYTALKTFAESGLPKEVLECCKSFDKPSPIQSHSWPYLLNNRDFIGIAATGSGKTLAFGVPAIMHVLQKQKSKTSKRVNPLCLVLSPTRELAQQISDVLCDAGKPCGLQSVCVYGGTSKGPQISALKSGVDIVIGTPGRLKDLIEMGVCYLKEVSFVEISGAMEKGSEFIAREALMDWPLGVALLHGVQYQGLSGHGPESTDFLFLQIGKSTSLMSARLSGGKSPNYLSCQEVEAAEKGFEGHVYLPVSHLFFPDGTGVSLGYENFDKMAFSMAFKLPDFLTAISWQVLDEADRMLDMGFEPEVRSILSQTCTTRQMVMFSATWPLPVHQLAQEFMDPNPVKVVVGSEDLAANHDVMQIVEVLDDRSRDERLVSLLEKYHKSQRGWKAVSIHGDKAQHARTEALSLFKEGSCPLMIATDVAARGLDIPDVEVVINYSFPLTTEDYVHRIGRTGRAGKKGVAHTFFMKENKGLAGELVNVLREAGQIVPTDLLNFGTHVKKKRGEDLKTRVWLSELDAPRLCLDSGFSDGYLGNGK
ncbi:DEA(D/H)-box RNA helicase family protein [Actinidia rufa]|uniref:RNA helicase n=1 Tax=Actinidia rufa TaxID=165716 RepID=A0A7J0H1Z6_9ERIC|nr:DEA(D/H)-box RNA helicase family protein [Actinidia rufa]